MGSWCRGFSSGSWVMTFVVYPPPHPSPIFPVAVRVLSSKAEMPERVKQLFLTWGSYVIPALIGFHKHHKYRVCGKDRHSQIGLLGHSRRCEPHRRPLYTQKNWLTRHTGQRMMGNHFLVIPCFHRLPVYLKMYLLTPCNCSKLTSDENYLLNMWVDCCQVAW